MGAIDLMPNLKTSSSSTIDIDTWKQSCYDAMNDDFNTPVVIANLFEAVRFINQIKENKVSITEKDLGTLIDTMNSFAFDILGLVNPSNSKDNSDQLEGAVELLIQMREEARANKDFALSDKIRDQLLDAGIQLKDGKEGTTFSTN